MKLRRPNLALSAVLILAAVTGCTTPEEKQATSAADDYLRGDYARATDSLAPLADQPDENYVLNNARLGSAALANFDFRRAEDAFLNAYDVINASGTNSGGRGAAAALVSEKMKVWKGEPFEKAMVNFYLGLVFYTDHDYDNARAAFENALLKLRDYGEDKNKENDKAAANAGDTYRQLESDFVLAHLMLGRAHLRLGDEPAARKAFDRAAELRPDLRPLADYRAHAKANVLLVVDYGYGPRRAKNKVDGSFVGFAPRPADVGPIPHPVVSVDGRPVAGGRRGIPVLPTVDLLALAQEKRWQDIDTIRAVKSVVGTGLIAGGAYEGYRAAKHDSGKDAAIAAGLIGAGILLHASAQADTRSWEMLPRTVFVIPLNLPPGRHDLSIDFPGANTRQAWRGIEAPAAGQEVTYYLRPQRTTQGPYGWPPPTLARHAAPTAPSTAAAPRTGAGGPRTNALGDAR